MDECFMCTKAAGSQYTLKLPTATHEKMITCDACAADLRDTEWLDICPEAGPDVNPVR